MTKNLKLHIKNVQIADAINLRGLKAKLSKKKSAEEEQVVETPVVKQEPIKTAPESKEEVAAVKESKAKAPKAKAKKEQEPEVVAAPALGPVIRPVLGPVIEQAPAAVKPVPPKPSEPVVAKEPPKPIPPKVPEKPPVKPEERLGPVFKTSWKDVPTERLTRPPQDRPPYRSERPPYRSDRPQSDRPPSDRPHYDRPHYDRSGPPRQGPPRQGQEYERRERPPYPPRGPGQYGSGHAGPRSDQPRPAYGSQDRRPGGFRPQAFTKPQPFARGQAPAVPKDTTKALERGARTPEKKDVRHTQGETTYGAKAKPKDTRDVAKPKGKTDERGFDARMRHGFRAADEDETGYRKKRPSKMFRPIQEQEIIRPSKISVRLPVSVKDLAQEMKLKASELISKLFLQGIIVTLNDLLDDETVVQLLGHEFGCEISIDTTEEERIRITGMSIKEEIAAGDADQLIIRPPVVAFMGHVDHGKTSLIDAIRKSNRVQHEVGAITQHIGAFCCHTSAGDITVLDTPGHEAFSHMRERGAEITDIVVLVVAGDEGMKEQTFEALQQAIDSKATIVVAINKCDKPNFDPDTVYRQLAEKNLLPEVWGGQTITVCCSAVSGKGIPELLEMLALQAEVLEIKANPQSRARGSVIESQMDKGLGPVSTVLVQNGTLRIGDCLVFAHDWARVKTMRDQDGQEVKEAGPSMPVRINGLSGLPEAGEEFIVVANEREAREISSVRCEGRRQSSFQTKKRLSFEGMVEKAQDVIVKKVLTLILRADVQGSVEALKNAIMKISSDKVEANIISTGVGLITESDVQRAQSSKAVIIGFHTQLESHLESLVKELGVQIRLHDIIYHAVDDVRDMMRLLLDKIKQEKDTGKVEVKALFKSSQLGIIAGCQVLDGTITRNNCVRVKRADKEIWKGNIASLKRNKDDVREVQKGMECGILLQGFTEFQEGDILEAFEVIYLSQDL